MAVIAFSPEPVGELVDAVDERDLDLREFGEAKDLVALPILACRDPPIELNLFLERAADAVNDVALDLGLETVRVDDDADVVRDDDACHPYLSGLLVHLQLDDRRRVPVLALVLHDRDPTAVRDVALARLLRRGSRLPARRLRRHPERMREPLVPDVPQAKLDRVDLGRAASSSMKLSLAKVFWIRAGERSGPVKNGESTVWEMTLAFSSSPSSSSRYPASVFELSAPSGGNLGGVTSRAGSLSPMR